MIHCSLALYLAVAAVYQIAMDGERGPDGAQEKEKCEKSHRGNGSTMGALSELYLSTFKG